MLRVKESAARASFHWRRFRSLLFLQLCGLFVFVVLFLFGYVVHAQVGEIVVGPNSGFKKRRSTDHRASIHHQHHLSLRPWLSRMPEPDWVFGGFGPTLLLLLFHYLKLFRYDRHCEKLPHGGAGTGWVLLSLGAELYWLLVVQVHCFGLFAGTSQTEGPQRKADMGGEGPQRGPATPILFTSKMWSQTIFTPSSVDETATSSTSSTFPIAMPSTTTSTPTNPAESLRFHDVLQTFLQLFHMVLFFLLFCAFLLAVRYKTVLKSIQDRTGFDLEYLLRTEEDGGVGKKNRVIYRALLWHV